MNLYSKEEIEQIERTKDMNDRLEDFFNGKRSDLNKMIEPLFVDLKSNFNLERKDRIIDIQSLGLSYRQMINEQISTFLNKRTKEEVKLKKLKQDKYIFYAIGSGLKVNNISEKALLIDAHLAEYERTIDIIDTYIEYLRASTKSLDSLSYSIKNIIELFNYLK